MTASSEQPYAAANRARLNAPTLDSIVSGLPAGFSGGWKPDVSDAEPWLQVSVIFGVLFLANLSRRQ